MKTKTFQETTLSCLGMGNMRLPAGADGKIDYEKAAELIDYVYDHGVNYFDTAWPYHSGESENFLGKQCKSIRGKVIIWRQNTSAPQVPTTRECLKHS